MYEEIKTKLQNFPDFRERRFRVKYLAKLALRSCGLENKEETKNALTLEELADFAQSYTSYDRIWRKVLNENEELRGKDWEDRREYEEKTQLDLGYDPLYNKKIYA
jgi:hypothetical protein